MSKYPNRRSNPSRWDNPDTITNQTQQGLNIDLAALNDWFGYCRMKYPSTFRGWSIEEFKRWNELRIAELDRTPKPQTYEEAKAEIFGNCIKRIEVE